MLFNEFFEKYPLIGFNSNSKNSFLFENKFSFAAEGYNFSLWRHEICHFVEREDNKVFDDNFGFDNGFGEPFVNPGDALAKKFIERETRVIFLENACTVITDNTFIDYGITNLNVNSQYLEHKIMYYKSLVNGQYSSTEYWWTEFNRKYDMLSKILNKNLVGV